MCGFAVYTGDDQMLRLQMAHDFRSLQYRGPDNTIMKDLGNNGWIGSHRLKIMDLSDNGNQPLEYKHLSLVCNGEVYNYRQIRKRYEKSFDFQSSSDCEVMIPLYLEKGIVGMAKSLDAEFACVIYDAEQNKYMAARDPIGIRPMFYGHTDNGKIVFASEMKALHEVCAEVHPFPPGYCYNGKEFVCYHDIAKVEKFHHDEQETIFKKINHLFTKAVEKRMDSDAPLGFMLSGGLDSSLVCAIAARMTDKPIRTFAVGIEDGPIDTKYARQVADYLRTDHTEVLFTKQDIFDTLSTLIYNTETWDITTIRASMGMYLLSVKFHKVVYDNLFDYYISKLPQKI
jgi:asparagine synthase (glutamine-hydrolysing)